MSNKLLLLLTAASLSISLCGCWFVYKPDIKQGNTLTTKQVSAIHPGMTEKEVIELLGKPVLVNLFAENQMIYVYTILPRYGEFQTQQLRIYFLNGRVSRYTSSVH